MIALVNRPLYGRDFRTLIRAATFEATQERRTLDRTQGIAIEKTKSRGRVVVTAKGRSMSSGAVSKQAWGTPVCPKSGLDGHPVIAIKPGLYWCRTCREGIRDKEINLELASDEFELELT